MMHAAKAIQGHKYQYGDLTVLAMRPGVVTMVREINLNEPYPLGPPIYGVKASWLVPLPMAYFHGEIPK